MKNPDAIRAQLVVGKYDRKNPEASIPALTAGRRICLTGTPIPNRPIELWNIAHWLFPDTFRSITRFKQRYCTGVATAYGFDANGASNLDELQRLLRESGMIRRLKKDVLTELPPKVRQVIELPAGSAKALVASELEAFTRHEERLEQLKEALELAKASDDPKDYADAVKNLRQQATVAFTEISAMRHRTAVAKVPAMAEMILDALEGGQPIVFFCHHKDVADAVYKIISGQGHSVVLGSGDISLAGRQAAVEKFQAGHAKLFIATIMAMGVGHTLTAASRVIFGELDWVPGNITQAEDRCHRIGQLASVLVQHVVLENSLDARMAQILVEKQDIIDQALDKELAPLSDEPISSSKPREQRAATEHETRDSIAETATKLTLEMKAAIGEALAWLNAANQDYASQRNGVGFNKFDTNIGLSLAQCTSLTDRQYALALKTCWKYNKTQLGGILDICESAVATKPKK